MGDSSEPSEEAAKSAAAGRIERLLFYELERVDGILGAQAEWAWKARAWAVTATAAIVGLVARGDGGSNSAWAVLGLYLAFVWVEVRLRRLRARAMVAAGMYRATIADGKVVDSRGFAETQLRAFLIDTPRMQPPGHPMTASIQRQSKAEGADLAATILFYGLLAAVAALALALR